MAKSWRLGLAKTRLAEKVGRRLAAEFHHACVMTLINRFQQAADHCTIAVWPPEELLPFQNAVQLTKWTVVPQIKGDLGEKMERQFSEAYDAGIQRHVLIGTDSPHLPVDTVHDAFSALDTHDVVIGPSDDGGFYLIGAPTRLPNNVFCDVIWGSQQVMAETLAGLNSRGLSVKLLATDFDVDTIDDLVKLDRLLKSSSFDELVWQRLRDVCTACMAVIV